MLAFLTVKDFAIIDKLEVEFKEGFNVITGETGAGKSIIINALSLLLSGRMPSDVVRSETEQAEVTGHYYANGEEYVVRRITGSQGKSRSYVNDTPVSLKRLEELGSSLVSVYGQNEAQNLLNRESYITIIDNLLSLDGDRRLLGEKAKALKETEALLEKKGREAEGQERERDLLAFQIEEIERENLKEDEEASVKERLSLLRDAEKIRAALAVIGEGLYEGDESVYAILGKCCGSLKPLGNTEVVRSLKSRLEALTIDAEDIFREAKRQEKEMVFDDEEAEKLEARLSVIFKLKEKYGKTYEQIRAFDEKARSRLAYLNTLQTDLSGLEARKGLIRSEIERLAEALSRARKKGALPIEKAIMEELAFLSMSGARFHIRITDKGTVDETGRDDLEFLLSTNPGEPLRPLRRVASGGELSRIMLAIKKVVGGEEGKTLIFDEVDAGIGGRVAELVGRRLRELSEGHQIICITHLPQIAVYGHYQFLVEKFQEKNRTVTRIRQLKTVERVREVARMLGGINITEKTLQRAEEMVRHVAETKN